MEPIAQIKRPGVLTRTFFKIGERMFGQVPTPERLMAHRLPLMLGMGVSMAPSSGSGRSTLSFVPCSTSRWLHFTACRIEPESGVKSGSVMA
jgi:hypothetical protein